MFVFEFDGGLLADKSERGSHSSSVVGQTAVSSDFVLTATLEM
jgi:hypothetical protein